MLDEFEIIGLAASFYNHRLPEEGPLLAIHGSRINADWRPAAGRVPAGLSCNSI
jgi:hypothetical protein